MSGLFDWEWTNTLRADDVPFDALIMAAWFGADGVNRTALEAAFPALCDEARRRYDASGGRLPEDGA